MANCEKCGIEIPSDEIYNVKGKTLCEDCATKAQDNPPHQCGQ